MSWIFNTLYVCFMIGASPWLLWRSISAGKNRRGWSHKLLGWVPRRRSTAECIWMHAVSVGEVNLLAPLIKQLRSAQPDLEVVISTTTETGYDLARQRYPEHLIFFFPLDFTWAIRRTLARIRPSILVLAELEVWPNLVHTCFQQGVPVAVVNGRLSENSFRGYQRWKWLLSPTFARLSLVAAQNETYAGRFSALGCKPANVVVTGSVKFDGVESDRNNVKTKQLKRLADLRDNEWVFLAGSTQLEEDLIAARVYRSLASASPNLRLILAPRHPERCDALESQLNQMGLNCQRRSRLDGNNQPENRLSQNLPGADRPQNPISPKPVLIIDVIGELGAWWGVADACYVGGSMGRRGGQNMIEPAAYGLPVAFGPHTQNFRELVEQLLDQSAAIVTRDQSELEAFLEQAIRDPAWAETMGQRAQSVVLNHVGASQRTVDSLSHLLDTNRGRLRHSGRGHRAA